MTLGLCVSPRHLPTPERMATMNPRGLAGIVYELDDIGRYLDLAGGELVLISLNNESREVGGDWSGWDHAVAEIARRYAGANLAVCCGHEFDIWWQDNRDDVPPAFAADLIRRASPVLRGAGIKVVTPPVAGREWVHYLAELVPLVADLVDGVAADLYGQNPHGWPGWGHGTLRGAVETIAGIAPGLPIYLREYGRERRDCAVAGMSAEDGQGVYVDLTNSTLGMLPQVARCFWFGYSEDMGKPEERGDRSLGLLNADGSETTSYRVFCQVNALPAPVAPEPPVPEPPPAPPEEPPTMTEYERWYRHESARRGIDPDTVVKAFNHEGGFREPAAVGKFSTGWSWWAPQLHYGGTGYERFGTVAGMGNDFTRVTGWAPGDPEAWRDAGRWALDHVRRHGWGAWYGAAAENIHGFDGVDRAHSWGGTPDDEWDYRRMEPTYDPDEPARAQEESFDCSQESLEWAMHAWGRTPSDDWLESTMIAEGVMSPSLGLLDASGAGLAAFVNRHYAELGYVADHDPSVSYDEVRAMVGRYPVLIGGRRWNHWSGVRGYDPNVGLLLANPADGHMGVGQAMVREQFAALGPFSAVTIQRPGGQAPPAPEPAPDPLAALTAERDALLSAVAHLADVTVPNAARAATEREAALAEAERIRVEMVGPRPAA